MQAGRNGAWTGAACPPAAAAAILPARHARYRTRAAASRAAACPRCGPTCEPPWLPGAAAAAAGRCLPHPARCFSLRNICLPLKHTRCRPLIPPCQVHDRQEPAGRDGAQQRLGGVRRPLGAGRLRLRPAHLQVGGWGPPAGGTGRAGWSCGHCQRPCSGAAWLLAQLRHGGQRPRFPSKFLFFTVPSAGTAPRRLYARYFGGDLSIISMEGYGTGGLKLKYRRY